MSLRKTDWQSALNEVRKILKDQMQSHQFRVAELALLVCTVKHGGNRDTPNTLVSFAKDLGIDPKLLYRWVEVKRNVYDKLPKDTQDIVSYNMCHAISRRVDSKCTPKEIDALAFEMLDSNKDNLTIIKYCSRLRSLAYRFHHTDALDNTSKKILEEVLFFTMSVQESINKKFPTLKPQENLMSSRYQVHNSMLGMENNLVGKFTTPTGEVLTLKEKEDDIYKYLQKKKVFTSPTEIGMKLGKHKRDAASAWACRSLQKLEKFDLVEANKQGLYKVKRDVGDLDNKYQ